MQSAVYPGSFDPITNGHLDIIQRASRVFEKVVVAVLHNSRKKPYFDIDERVELIKKVVEPYENVEVTSFEGLLVNFMKTKPEYVLVKGLRAFSDFEYEFQMAMMNRKLDESIETLFMMTGNRYSFVSSTLVKEIFLLNGNIEELVPPLVYEALNTKKEGTRI
jgi:pantetheine-phosphate adenylyltransferase